MTDRIFSEDNLLLPGRRQLLLASLLAALPLGLSSGQASAVNVAETQITLPDQIEWTAWTAGPPHSAELATLLGGLDKPGEYVVLMKWYPGYMSAPHSYATDRLCPVLSGTWWVNSGTDSTRMPPFLFRPAALSGASLIRRITTASGRAPRNQQ